MKQSTVLRLAIEAIDHRIRRLAPNANLYDMFGMESGRRDFEKVSKLRQAKRQLTEELDYLQ